VLPRHQLGSRSFASKCDHLAMLSGRDQCLLTGEDCTSNPLKVRRATAQRQDKSEAISALYSIGRWAD
jgi:hypothetical protein